MEWMATITGDHVGYPGFWDLGDFSPRRKNLGSKNLRIFQRQIFTVESLKIVFVPVSKGGRVYLVLDFFQGRFQCVKK